MSPISMLFKSRREEVISYRLPPPPPYLLHTLTIDSNDTEKRQSYTILRTSFARANLPFGNFQNSKLDWATFEGADLRGGDSRGASVVGADFSSSQLDGCLWKGAKYSSDTTWPKKFNLDIHEMTKVRSSVPQSVTGIPASRGGSRNVIRVKDHRPSIQSQKISSGLDGKGADRVAKKPRRRNGNRKGASRRRK